MKTFLEAIGVGGGTATLIYLLIAFVSVAAIAFAIFVTRQEEHHPQAAQGEGEVV